MDALKWYENMEDQRKENAKRRLLEAEFSGFDCNTLPKMTEAELAKWQARYPMDSPQYIVAFQEWNRRALVRQLKSLRWSTIVTIISSVLCTILGVILGALLTRNPNPSPQKLNDTVSIESQRKEGVSIPQQTEKNKSKKKTDDKGKERRADIEPPISQKP